MRKYFLSSLMIVVGFVFISSFNPTTYYQQATQPAIVLGKKVYTTYCLSCHQVDGGGVPHLNPPLDAASLVQGNDTKKLIKVILEGMNERVEIDGEYYSNSMASHAFLNDAEVAAVLTYIRNSWSNKASAVQATEVKWLRQNNNKHENKKH